MEGLVVEIFLASYFKRLGFKSHPRHFSLRYLPLMGVTQVIAYEMRLTRVWFDNFDMNPWITSFCMLHESACLVICEQTLPPVNLGRDTSDCQHEKC